MIDLPFSIGELNGLTLSQALARIVRSGYSDESAVGCLHDLRSCGKVVVDEKGVVYIPTPDEIRGD
jgi:hypothetical protein